MVAALVAGALTVVWGVIAAWINRSTATKIETLRNDLTQITQRAIEQHRFRHEIGQFTAQERLSAYVRLGELVTDAYRERTTHDWKNAAEMAIARDRLNDAKNFFYDRHYFFTDALSKNFQRISRSLSLEWPDRDVIEENLQSFINTIRTDLLLDELADSAIRAVDAAAAGGDVTITSP